MSTVLEILPAEKTDAPGPPATLCTMRVADRANVPLDPDRALAATPGDPRARNLVFDLHLPAGDAAPVLTSQLALMHEICQVEHALQELYPEGQADSESRFRPYFVRLFHIAQLALEGDVDTDTQGKVLKVGGRLSEEAARAEVKSIAADLIDDAAPGVKTRHLRELGTWAGLLAAPALLAYALLMLGAGESSDNLFSRTLQALQVQPGVAANCLLLWAGTMVGVCLSYAFRTTEFTIADLTRTDSEHLPPPLRLAITGALAALLVLFALAGLGDVGIGSMKLSDVTSQPMLAVVVGALLGIGEKSLSGTVAKKAGDLFGGVK